MLQINTISEFHEIASLPKPQHPLISLVDYGKVDYQLQGKEVSWLQGFYTIALKRDVQGKLTYGHRYTTLTRDCYLL